MSLLKGQTDYKVYTALISQTGTNPPEIIVLENTLGFELTPKYQGAGSYTLDCVEQIFNENKTTFAFNQNVNNMPAFISMSTNGENSILIKAINPLTMTEEDGLFPIGNSCIEIKIYK